MREFEADQLEFRKVAQNAQNFEEKKKLARNHRGANPAFYAGAFLDIAEKFPGTPAAEDGLIWIATHLVYSSMAERAKDVIAQDFARSDKLEPLFSHREVVMAGSKPTERLFRVALAQNANRKNQGLACYYLSRTSIIRPRSFGFTSCSIRQSWIACPTRERNAGAGITPSGFRTWTPSAR